MSNQPPETSRAQSDTIDELSSFTNLLRHRDENEVEKTLEERFQVEFDFSDVEAECNQMIKEVNQLEIQFNTQNEQINKQPLDVLDLKSENHDSDDYDKLMIYKLILEPIIFQELIVPIIYCNEQCKKEHQ